MKSLYLGLMLAAICIQTINSQEIKSFFYADESSRDLPVFIRGNLQNKIILIYVQGGPGISAIDFARSDYPGWKETLEKEVAIAYYDQRGLNKKIKDIDPASINVTQYGNDIIKLAEILKEKYNCSIYLLGHSMGGVFVSHCLDKNPARQDLISGAIISNTPLTNDYSPERFNYYRPLYLKNLSMEFIEKGKDVEKWKEAYEWMEKADSIYPPEVSRKWNQYVESAFEPTERKITMGMVFKVLFSRPYNPIKYVYNKDNNLVQDLLLEKEKDEKPLKTMMINYPVLIITGRYDDIAPPEEMKVMNQLINNSRLVILPDAGHESYLDQPAMFQDSILEFLNISN